MSPSWLYIPAPASSSASSSVVAGATFDIFIGRSLKGANGDTRYSDVLYVGNSGGSVTSYGNTADVMGNNTTSFSSNFSWNDGYWSKIQIDRRAYPSTPLREWNQGAFWLAPFDNKLVVSALTFNPINEYLSHLRFYESDTPSGLTLDITLDIPEPTSTAPKQVGSGALYNTAFSVDSSSDYLYIGGKIRSAHGITAEGLVRWDGSTWENLSENASHWPQHYHLLVTGPKTKTRTIRTGYTNKIKEYQGSTGDILVGGDFFLGNSDEIAVDSNFEDTVRPNYYSFILARQNHGLGGIYRLIVDTGEIITPKPGTTAATVPENFQSEVLTTTYPPVIDFDVDSSGTIYVGGRFENAYGQQYNSIAKWSGSSADSLATLSTGLVGDPNHKNTSDSTSYPAFVSSVNVDSNDDVYITGSLVSAGGVTCDYVTKWNGTAFESVGIADGNRPPEVISDAKIDSSDRLYTVDVAGSIRMWDGSDWDVVASDVTQGNTFSNEQMFVLYLDENNEVPRP